MRMQAFLRLLAGADFPRWPVLQDISFAIQPGQSLGIIGENGAGKSTLLKLLCGVLNPTSGRIVRRGSIGALLELGAGFDAERSGRENIALAASLLGWSAAEIRTRESEVIAFADIGRHIDEPVKHYSSGMVVRLGFAIIAAVRPALLITDEVLAVGDESFQKKCVRWMEDYLEGGGTLLLVSHSMYHVQKLCKHALWLQGGRVEAYGDVFDVTQSYLAYHERKSAQQIGGDLEPGYSGADYRITRVWIDGSEDAMPRMLTEPRPFTVEIELYSPESRAPHVAVGIVRADGTPVYGTSSEIERVTPVRTGADHVLLPGGYTLKMHAMDPEGLRLFDTVERGLVVRGNSREFGLVRLDHRWLG
jgi:lipopolysaccharide transport system ATP-binding protein